MYQYVLFDLDGTLTDPKLGITKSVQYALGKFGIEEPNRDKLEPFIGPPLKDSFRDFYGMNDTDCENAIVAYREYFEEYGIKENQIYSGMKELLAKLKEEGVTLIVASSKPDPSVHVVLKLFDIEQYFDIIVGSLKDGTRVTKIEVMQEAFRQLREFAKRKGRKIDLTSVLMVGDRKFDVEGAKHFGVDSVAVTYGYASQGELLQADPTWLADSVSELEEVILQRPNYCRYQGMASFAKTVQILWPLAFYWFWEMLIFNVGYLIVAKTVGITTGNKAPISVFLNAIAAISTWPFLWKLFHTSTEMKTSPVIERNVKRKVTAGIGIIISYALSLAIGMNMFVTVLQLNALSDRYEQVASTQYSVPLLVGLLIYGIITPITEEFIFRGVIYNRTKKYFPVPIAFFLSAIVFGCYHGNLVQAVYASIMGLAMAFVYEYYNSIVAPIIFHCSANLVIYWMSKTIGQSLTGGVLLYSAVFLVFALGITFWLYMQAKKERKRYFR